VVRRRRAVDGIVRDPDTGIVIARENRHPGADMFRSAPMGEGLPGMNLPVEAEHILAIHFFDNLGYLLAPPNPLYEPIDNPEQRASTGTAGVLWVPIEKGARRSAPEEDETVIVADISGYDANQIAAMKAQIRQREIADKLLEQADPHVRENGEL
jgi:hypothetical protein